MEDFYYAGGLPAVIRALGEGDLIHRDALTVNGKTIGENCQAAPIGTAKLFAPVNDRWQHGGIAVLRGNLAPDGAVSSLRPLLHPHEASRAAPWCSRTSSISRSASTIPALDVDENCVMVLKNCGPRVIREWPKLATWVSRLKCLQRGFTDMVRISDARMSGTAFGTVVLHVCPEAAVGGNLALVCDGDTIELDVERGRLHLDVSEEDLAAPPRGLACARCRHGRRVPTALCSARYTGQRGCRLRFSIGLSRSRGSSRIALTGDLISTLPRSCPDTPTLTYSKPIFCSDEVQLGRGVAIQCLASLRLIKFMNKLYWL